MAEENVCFIGMLLIGAPLAGCLGLFTSFQVRPTTVDTVDGTVTECYSRGVVIELAVAWIALLVAQVFAVRIFVDNSPSSDSNTRKYYIKLILKTLIGFTCVAFVGAEVSFIVGYAQLENGQRCGTSLHLKILRGAAALCFVQFASALIYYVVALVGRRSLVMMLADVGIPMTPYRG